MFSFLVVCLLACPRADGPKATPEEEAVRAFVLDNADDPDSVKFARFGPHDLKAAAGATAGDADRRLAAADIEHLGLDRQVCLDRLRRAGGKRPLPLVRARYRLKNKAGALELHDMIFAVAGGRVVPFSKNQHADEWLQALRPDLGPWR